MTSPIVSAQDMQKHLWQDRVILIMASSYSDQLLQRQLDLLIARPEELSDRKLVIYTTTPNGYTEHFPNPKSKSFQDACQVPATKLPTFKIVLIGLDGLVKLESSSVVSSSTLFETIDQMPMRRLERTKN